MVHLKQIAIKDNIASATYHPEDINDGGFLKVNLSTGDIIEHTMVDGFSFNYVHHAAKELKRIFASNENRTESVAMWY
ncbi:MAG: hypothetical protein IJL62_02580 [Clostridia bacterium]|nr:hypothetical protein [Clostridia bacterium]